MLQEILAELVKIDDILFVIRSNGVTGEIRSNSLSIKQKEKWITLGDNDGPAHMHINAELVKNAKFVTEEKPERTSFSVQFFDDSGTRVLAGFFTKMYDAAKNPKPERKKLFDSLCEKYGKVIEF